MSNLPKKNWPLLNEALIGNIKKLKTLKLRLKSYWTLENNKVSDQRNWRIKTGSLEKSVTSWKPKEITLKILQPHERELRSVNWNTTRVISKREKK